MGSNQDSVNPMDGEDVYCIKKCNRIRCVTCLNRLCMDVFVENHITKERFDILLDLVIQRIVNVDILIANISMWAILLTLYLLE